MRGCLFVLSKKNEMFGVGVHTSRRFDVEHEHLKPVDNARGEKTAVASVVAVFMLPTKCGFL